VSVPWASIIAGTTAVFSAAATGGAWLAARRANTTAEAVARIETARWHADLTPELRVTMERAGDGLATLSVHLAGPLPLGRLDEIRVVVVPSDDADRTVDPSGRLTREQVDAQVWGPYRFQRGVDGADAAGRTVAPFSLRVGAGRPFSVERTSPPTWMRDEGADRQWEQMWLNKPTRLVFTCARDGLEPWTVPYEVTVPQSSQVRFL
jgi:hypothetical protein